MQRCPRSFVFHWDATYKINSLSYPVLVCGISDVARQFHPVAFFLLGGETEDDYTWAMRELMTMYSVVVGEPLRLSFVMSDAARAPALAVRALQDELGVEKALMCFYHCIANVHKRLAGFLTATKALVFRHMYNLHYSRSESELRHHWTIAEEVWLRCEELTADDFVAYFTRQWLRGP